MKTMLGIRQFCADVLARRRASPSDKDGLFSAMLNRRDPVSGLQLSNSIIIDNMITFLLAGLSAPLPQACVCERQDLSQCDA